MTEKIIFLLFSLQKNWLLIDPNAQKVPGISFKQIIFNKMRFHVYPLDYSFKFEAPVRTAPHRTRDFRFFWRTAPHYGIQNLSGHRTAPAFLKAKPAPHRTAPGEFWKIWNPA